MKFKIKANVGNEKEALATYLNADINELKEIDKVFDIPTFSYNEEEYSITDDEDLIHKAVEDSLENLFDGLTVEEFCEKIISYLYRGIDDYIFPFDDTLTAQEQYEEGLFDGVWGYKFQGNVDFEKMADDVINSYGAGHELSSYDANTDEINYKGSTYYIFRQK